MVEQFLKKGAPHAPPLWAAALAAVALCATTAYLRLELFPTETVPLGFGIPLLICFWARDRRVLYAMAVVLSAIAIAKIHYALPPGYYDSPTEKLLGAAMRLADVWIMAGVIGAVVSLRERLVRTNRVLADNNEHLETANAELASHEEEIARQNEELQTQTEELEQQTEELRQQGEELAQQNEEYQILNEELGRRERALSALLETARSIGSGLSDQLFTALCKAVMKVLDGHSDAVAVLHAERGELLVSGYAGTSETGLRDARWAMEQSFAKIVMDRGQTGYIKDLDLRPDIQTPQPVSGRKLRSLLAAPLLVNGRPVGTLEAFSYEPRDWTQQEFQVLEWAAAHCALIIEAAKLQEELEQRRRDADEAATRKTRFLAAVSHDVRTPANAIGLLAEFIEQTAGAGEQAQAEIPVLARELRESARSLVSLVTEVLDLSRFDSGKVDLQIASFSLNQAVALEAQRLTRLAEQKGLRLELDCRQEIRVDSDRVKLTRVLNNLIENAIKFTENGSVKVSCGRTNDGGARVLVADTGMGIPEDQIAHIFDEFYQLRNPARDRSKGTGLGLAISKRLADALGCELEVTSAVGKGTAFTLTLPASAVEDAPLATPCPAVQTLDGPGKVPMLDGQPLSGLRVLLVEDHPASREVTSRLLASHGAEVITAADGRIGMHRLFHDDPHVLLLDLMLPDMDGREILRAVQDRRPARLRCSLAVSGDLTTSRLEEVRRLGADGLIPKPLDFGKLVEAIKTCVGARPGLSAAASKTGKD